MDNQMIARAIVAALRANGVKPEIHEDAAAGADYGQVSMWACDDRGGYVVEWGDNGQTNYDIMDDVSDPIGWMIPDDLTNDPATVANYRGVDAVDEYDGDGVCRVMVTRSYYGPSERSGYAAEDTGTEMVFDDRGAAQAWIDEIEGGEYVLSHGESSSPDYKIVIGR